MVSRRTGLAGVDSVAVIRNGGLWVSDNTLGLLHQAVPLAFIGTITKVSNMAPSINHFLFSKGTKLGCQIYPPDVLSSNNAAQIHLQTTMMIGSKMKIS